MQQVETDQGDEAKNSGGVGTESLVSHEHGSLVGRELDAAIANRVMGLSWGATRCEVCGWPINADVPSQCHVGNCSMRPRPLVNAKEKATPRYSTDIAAAMEVVERLIFLGYRYVIRGNYNGNNKHWVGFDKQEWADLNPLYQSDFHASLPEAICRAAICAVLDTPRMASQASK